MSSRESTAGHLPCTPAMTNSLSANGAAESQSTPKSATAWFDYPPWRRAELRDKYSPPDAYEPDEVDE